MRAEIGSVAFEQVWRHFHSVRHAGYGLDGIVHTDTSALIDRDGWQDLEDEEEEEQEDEEEQDNVRLGGEDFLEGVFQ